ncbi:unnamed protein product [Durusdinium trenchii]|uniref:Secreted protein n=1 Tax=Durusdinium trenchii TaxID=1381693 RepID=A0ABP0M2F0_9DINO
MPGATSSFLLLVARPLATSSFLLLGMHLLLMVWCLPSFCFATMVNLSSGPAKGWGMVHVKFVYFDFNMGVRRERERESLRAMAFIQRSDGLQPNRERERERACIFLAALAACKTLLGLIDVVKSQCYLDCDQ